MSFLDELRVVKCKEAGIAIAKLAYMWSYVRKNVLQYVNLVLDNLARKFIYL